MAVVKNDSTADRGEKDARRHRDIVKEEVKKKAVDAIINTPVAGKSGKIKVKIPYKKSYFFRHQPSGEGGAGVGTGDGKPGDIIPRRKKDGEGEGGAGNTPGEDFIETEIDLAEIFEWLCEELGLPKLKKREGQEIEVRTGYKQSGIKRTGIPSKLKKKLTAKKAMKRVAGVVLGLKQMLQQKLGQDPQLEDRIYIWAWFKSLFDKDQALVYLEKVFRKEIQPGEKELQEASVNISNEDLRYKKFEPAIEYQSNAVIIAIMDVSGSMTDEKKLIARSFYWWAFNFLRTVYQNVKIVFITHHTEAKVVSEEEFFHRVESGGTVCASGLKLAKELVDTQFPLSRWNTYVMHFSDGEDWAPEETVKAINALLPICNAVGYGEIMHDGEDSLLEDHLLEALKLKKVIIDQQRVYVLDQEPRYFIGTSLEDRKDIWPTIKAFFRKEEVK